MVLWFMVFMDGMENHGANECQKSVLMCLPIKFKESHVLDRKPVALE